MVNKPNWIQRQLSHSCVLCGQVAPGPHDVCPDCAPELPHHRMACHRCAMPLPSAAVDMCARCLQSPPRFTSCVAAFRYVYPVAELISRFKFSGDLVAGRVLAELLAERVSALAADRHRNCVLVAIPLHATRLRERGFNQAERIARVLAKRLRMPMKNQLLLRPHPAADQKQLSAAERRANMRGVFRAGDCSGRHIVLIDDVVTTGATAEAAATALLLRGAREVHVWCLARAL